MKIRTPKIYGFLYLSNSIRKKIVATCIAILFLCNVFAPKPVYAYGGALAAGAAEGIAVFEGVAIGVGASAAVTAFAPALLIGAGIGYLGAELYDKYYSADNASEQKAKQSPSEESISGNTNEVPEKAKELERKINENGGKPLPGYKGGQTFKNREKNPNLKPGVTYREYDVNIKSPGQPRDSERLVIGKDGSAFYTPNHYENLIPIK
jgi:guanyl-specific ribonuclease Sa